MLSEGEGDALGGRRGCSRDFLLPPGEGARRADEGRPDDGDVLPREEGTYSAASGMAS